MQGWPRDWDGPEAVKRLGLTISVGALAFDTLFGFVSIYALTVVGIPLVILTLIRVYSLGNLFGIYATSFRWFTAFGQSSKASLAMRLVVSGKGICVTEALNFFCVFG